MDSHVVLTVLTKSIFWVASSSAASFDVSSLVEGNLRPEHYPQSPTASDGFNPAMTFAYTEVMTPYYHYYFYAPAFKTSFEDSNPAPSSLYGNPPPYGAWNFPQDRKPFSEQWGNEYYSPRFNDVRYPPQDETTLRPKFYQNHFLEKPYSATFNNFEPPFQKVNPYYSTSNNYEPRHPSENPIEATPSFLPTVLISGTSNIIRNENQSSTFHQNRFRPYSYAPTFKDRSPHDRFEPQFPSNKPLVNPSLFSSATPNIIRDEVSSINKLFKPVSSTQTNNNFHSRQPSSTTPSYPFTSRSSFGSTDRYHPFSSVSPTLSPSLSTRPPPFPDYSVEETLVPIFTPSSTPEGFTTPSSTSLYSGRSTGSPTVLFEAPGHSQPK